MVSILSLGSWMSLLVTILQPMCGYMSVYLRGRQATVPQKLLHAADIGAVVQQVRGEAMAKAVRTGASVQAGAGQIFLQQPADTAGRQPGAVLVQKHSVHLLVRHLLAGLQPLL